MMLVAVITWLVPPRQANPSEWKLSLSTVARAFGEKHRANSAVDEVSEVVKHAFIGGLESNYKRPFFYSEVILC